MAALEFGDLGKMLHKYARLHLRSGFTLVEMMLAITIIAILLAFALPKITEARISGNEASAIGDLKTFFTALTQFRMKYLRWVNNLSELQDTGLVVGFEVYGAGNLRKDAYRYTFFMQADKKWQVRAFPRTPGVTGHRYFTLMTRGSIHWSDRGQATFSDPAID